VHDLRRYGAAARDLRIEQHERGQWKNNRAETSDQPSRRKERKMQMFLERRFSTEIHLSARRRLQRFQPSTPSDFNPNAPNASHCGDEQTARRWRSSLRIRVAPPAGALRLAT
jgi:transposase-like protein